MRSIAPFAIAGLLALTACGKHDDGVSMKNASLDDVARTQKTKIQPGEWAITMEMVDQKTTGGPANMPSPPKMPPMTTKVCITPEQVNRPEGMFGGGSELKKNCTYDTFDMVDGKIDARMHCNMPNGMKIEASNSGTFSATEISSDSTSTVTGLPGGMATTAHSKMSAKRLGECAPGDPKAGAPAGNAKAG